MQPGPHTTVAPALEPPAGEPGYEPVLFADHFASRIGMMYAEPEH